MTHELKILPRWFKDVAQGLKNFEIRENDRDYKVGDILILKEWDGEHYTGAFIKRCVGYVYYGNGEYGVDEGYCILGLYPYNGKLKTVGEWLDAQPCEDAISREDLIDAISNLNYWHANQYGELRPGGAGDYATVYKANDVERMADDLPSVTPIKPEGKWEEYCRCYTNGGFFTLRCSECRKEAPIRYGTQYKPNFCPNCGAKMVEPQESEDKE